MTSELLDDSDSLEPSTEKLHKPNGYDVERAIFRAEYAIGFERGRRIAVLGILNRSGMKKFGPMPHTVMVKLNSIIVIEYLEDLAERLLDVATWDELLADS